MASKQSHQGSKYEPFWYGFINILISTSFLTLTALVGIAIRWNENFLKWTSYQITFWISVCDFAQLIAHVFSGVSLMLEWDMPDLLGVMNGLGLSLILALFDLLLMLAAFERFSLETGITSSDECTCSQYMALLHFRTMRIVYRFDSGFVDQQTSFFSNEHSFLGSILSTAWISSSIYGILLAIHRLLAVVFPLQEMKYFTGKRKTIIFAIVHSTIPILTIMKWTNWNSYKFYRKDFLWCYDRSLLLSDVFYVIDGYAMVPLILCSFVCYSMIFYTIKTQVTKKKRCNTATLSVFVYCVFCTFNFILWRFVEPLLEPKPIVYFWTSLPWIFWNGTHAIICICFNRSIRGNLLEILRCRRPTHKQKILTFIKNPQMAIVKNLRFADSVKKF